MVGVALLGAALSEGSGAATDAPEPVRALFASVDSPPFDVDEELVVGLQQLITFATEGTGAARTYLVGSVLAGSDVATNAATPSDFSGSHMYSSGAYHQAACGVQD